MMWLIINVLFSVAIMIEILYLFTCGQQYMKMSVLRARRHYITEKMCYAGIGSVAALIAVLCKKPEPETVLMTIMVSALIYLKCLTVFNYRKRNIV